MMNLRVLPQKVALVLAITAFGVVWGGGCCGMFRAIRLRGAR